MPSVVLTQAQINNISSHFCQTQFVASNLTATCATNDITAGISSLAMSVSIGGGSISYSPAFQPPLTTLSAAQQAALRGAVAQGGGPVALAAPAVVGALGIRAAEGTPVVGCLPSLVHSSPLLGKRGCSKPGQMVNRGRSWVQCQ